MKDAGHRSLDTALARGASYADVRVMDIRQRYLSTKNSQTGQVRDSQSFGIGVRVIANGAWGFAATDDLTAESIDLYLKSSGNELDRAEATDAKNAFVLREQNRKTVGSTMVYTSADDRYEIKGTPVSITDPCGRVTSGRTLIFRKATDTIEVDGNQRVRTQTKNGDKCQVTTR